MLVYHPASSIGGPSSHRAAARPLTEDVVKVGTNARLANVSGSIPFDLRLQCFALLVAEHDGRFKRVVDDLLNRHFAGAFHICENSQRRWLGDLRDMVELSKRGGLTRFFARKQGLCDNGVA